MNAAYAVLLSRIALVCGGKVKGELPKADPRALYTLAKAHSVVNLLYYAEVKDRTFPDDLFAVLEADFFALVQRRLQQEHAAKKLFAALDGANVPYLPMKGEGIRASYPEPDMRVSGDVDVYYDKEKRREVDAIMASLGYTLLTNDANHEEYQKSHGVLVEMHRNLLIDFPTVDAYYADLWQRLLPVKGSEYKMTDEDFYIYMTVHSMKHYVSGGTGLRSVLDVFMFLKHKPDLDRGYLNAELDKLSLRPFCELLETLASVWFGGAEMPADLEASSAYILSSGTYGTSENRAYNESSRKGGRIGYLFSRAFPPYYLMKEKYPRLQKAPLLLPCYWAKRLFFGLLGKNSMQDELRAAKQANGENQKQLQSVMKRAGLDGYR